MLICFPPAAVQIVVIDPTSTMGHDNPNVGLSLASLRTAPDAYVPYPNQCTGSPFRYEGGCFVKLQDG